MSATSVKTQPTIQHPIVHTVHSILDQALQKEKTSILFRRDGTLKISINGARIDAPPQHLADHLWIVLAMYGYVANSENLFGSFRMNTIVDCSVRIHTGDSRSPAFELAQLSERVDQAMMALDP
jgi:hypothetical protein